MPVKGIPSARQRGDSVDAELPLSEFIAFNTPQKLYQDNSTTNVPPAPAARRAM
jgi:hypothetical protein